MTTYPSVAARREALADALRRRTDAWAAFLATPAGGPVATAYQAFLESDAAEAALRREEWRVPNGAPSPRQPSLWEGVPS